MSAEPRTNPTLLQPVQAIDARGLARSDLQHCNAIMRAGSKSFSLAARLLPKYVRPSVAVFYAYCRVADDAIDESEDPHAALLQLKARLDGIYAAAPQEDPVHRAMVWLVHRHQVPRAPLDDLLEGFAWDAAGKLYETFDDVQAYAVRVASTVGVVMTWLLGGHRADTLARACDLGIAMQLTNIARDVGEDARRGRLYLPLDWLAEEGIDGRAWLQDPQDTPEVRRVVQRLLEAAAPIYASSDQGIALLPRAARWSIRAARLIYADIGRVIAKNSFDSFTSRSRTGAWRKLSLALRAWGALFWNVRGPAAPCLPAAASLVGRMTSNAPLNP